MSREYVNCRLIEELCNKLMNIRKRSRIRTQKIQKNTLSQVTLLIIYYDLNFFRVYVLEKSRQGC